MAIDKTYDPVVTEAKQYPRWEKSGAFAADQTSSKKPFTIMIPPPNVTGHLHMGHALVNTLQDVLIRYYRMKGRDALWLPGTDHAGIATQMVVERELAKEGLSRREMGREKFLERVWAWKEQSGGTITRQLRRLGASCDWSRERFTMDEGLNKAVTEEFVRLYRDGLIYKDKRLVNWDCKLQTAVSDLEVDSEEVRGNLWHFRYPIEGTDRHIVVATTRPETMLGDTAVAVNPADDRYRDVVGKNVVLPLVGRRIPIIADDYADPETGTGAVKITPAHDFNDFAVGKRHKLPMINIFDQHAHLNAEVPEKYRGLERFAARKQIVADLEALELVEKIEPHTHKVPHSQRTGVVIEPWLSDQWYVDATTLAKPAIQAVEDGRTQFVPAVWTNTYMAWMRELQPWCISRQLWWGHQIPAWYGPDGKFFVAHTEAEAQKQADAHYGKPVVIERDPDVFDTWFSSALWPFSTLGWPDQTVDLKRYYPGDVLVTGHDIITFWVSRMMMMGLHFMGDVPFHKVYINALVRDEKGQKMSKTKGNVIDPLEIIDQYGCDALRFTLTQLSTSARDIRLAPARIEANRNFATKIWNAARFLQMNECVFDPAFTADRARHPLNRWIIGMLRQTGLAVDDAFAEPRFDLLAQAMHSFTWDRFCDWYLEFAKPLFQGDDAALKSETRATAAWVFAQILKLLHPVMPFVTEELWGGMVDPAQMLMTAPWTDFSALPDDRAAVDEVEWVIRLIVAVRAVRSELNVPAGAQIALQVRDANLASQGRLKTYEPIIKRLARLDRIEAATTMPKGAVQVVFNEATLILPLADVIDLNAERARLEKESVRLKQDIAKLEQKLTNQDFIARAPAEVVDEQRERKAESEATLAKLQAAVLSIAG